MRPLQPITLLADLEPAEQDRSVLEALLIDARGSWCSICERPILEQAWAWDARAQATVLRTGMAVDKWSDWLLLCEECQDAQSETAPDRRFELALPLVDNTFTIDEGGVFRYELVESEVLDLDAQGRAVNATVRPLAIVRSDDLRGQATIERFALNGNLSDGQILADPERRDRRVELRTAVWQSARRLSRDLEHLAPSQLVPTIIGTGFVSTWLTVFGNELGPDAARGWATYMLGKEVPGTDLYRLLGRPEPL